MTDRIAEKLYHAFYRDSGTNKVPAFDAAAPNNVGWLRVADTAIALVCKPDGCEHVAEAIEHSTESLSAAVSKIDRMTAEHAAALEEAVQNAEQTMVDEGRILTNLSAFQQLDAQIADAVVMAKSCYRLDELTRLLELRVKLHDDDERRRRPVTRGGR